MEKAWLPHQQERTTLDADRSDARAAGARALAKAGRLGRAASLILRNRLGRPGVRPSDLELRQREADLREVEMIAEAGEAARLR
jgi:hypothetical protein